MAKAIPLKGPWKYLAIGAVLAFLLGNWVLPELLSSATGSGGRSYRLLRSGYTEQYKTNLTDHWITAAKGNWKSGWFPALSGETLVLEVDTEIEEGRFALYLWEYSVPPFKDIVWSSSLNADGQEVLSVPIESSGLYTLWISYFNFSGDITLGWRVE